MSLPGVLMCAGSIPAASTSLPVLGNKRATRIGSGLRSRSDVESGCSLGKAGKGDETMANPVSACPLPECGGAVMSNFDREVEPDAEEVLARGWGEYTAWDFFGRVWKDGARYKCEVWRYGSPACVMEAGTLPDLMRVVSDEWGWK
jgi:hypothetical protein